MKLGPIVAACCLCLQALVAQGRDADPIETARLQANPDRLIVVTVADSVRTVQGRPGSTPRGYDSMQQYTGTSAARRLADSIAKEFHLRQVAAWPIAMLKVHCVVFEIPPRETREHVLAQLKTEPRVQLAEPLATFDTRSEAYNDPYLGLQKGFQQLDVAEAHEVTRGEGVRVAIVDTGVDVTHPDLAHRIADERNYVDNDTQRFRADRHGTEIAGVIGALANNGLGIAGIAPAVRIHALKACWQLTLDSDAARCNSFTLAKALAAAIELRPQIVNLSLGGPMDPLLGSLVQTGMQRGIIFVGASSQIPGFPDAIPGVLAVGAAGGASSAHVLHAPGREILTLLPQAHYDFASGSSLAAAHVTGTVALLLAVKPQLDSAALYDLLERSSMTQVTNDTGSAEDRGSINACAALATLSPAATRRCSSSPASTQSANASRAMLRGR
jgi:hypothetical protein